MKKFITFEGIDGSGKSTVSKRVYEELKRRGYSAIYTFEPTDGEIGKCAKKCIDKGADPLVIALLFVADRIEHVRKIKEWLEEGHIVLCDRYVDSTYAYQSVQLEGQMEDPLEWLRQLSNFVIKPDRTFLFDIDPEEAISRIKGRKTTRFENVEFLKKVRKRYIDIATEKRFKVLDARKGIEDLVKECVEDIMENDGD